MHAIETSEISRDWSISDGHRAVDGSREPRAAAKAYTVVRPQDLAPILREAYGAHSVREKSGGFLGPRATILTVTPEDPAFHFRFGGDYAAPETHAVQAHILLDFAGKAAIRLRAGALRFACSNEFSAAPIRIHHSSRQARDFLANPLPFVRETLLSGMGAAAALESLRGIGDGYELFRQLRAARPRIAGQVVQYCQQYFYDERSSVKPDAWGMVQALTNVRGRSRQTCEEIASQLVRAPKPALCGVVPLAKAVWSGARWN